ncbi:MAG: sulfatase-like hydrolase/transferase [Acidobacteria bacterium]|nr:sulfatase-like hydrolase/transferase [Acidobacteriota bacterium]
MTCEPLLRFCNFAVLAVVVVAATRGIDARQPTVPVVSARPNIVLIVTDDQAAWSVGAYGNADARTPNMDRLAREGVRFANAFTPSPVCSPSRATMISGRYGTEVGITDWISPAENADGAGLPEELTTWPEALQRAGYRTGLVGKWHLGTQPRFHPTRHGYGHFMGFLEGGAAPMNPRLEVDGVVREVPGAEPDVITDAALAFLARERANPFALSVHYRAPHTPYGPVPEQDMAPFRDAAVTIPVFPGLDQAQVRQWTREYYASVHSIDRNIGRLMSALREHGLDDRTIVLFTSDHGYNIGHHGLHTKGNGTWIAGGINGPTMPNMFDTSLRPPLIVRGAGVRGGRTVDEMVSFVDLYPTLLAMAGVPMPADAPRHGLDITPLLRGDETPLARDAIYGQYDIHHYAIAHLRMIRETGWKLVRSYGTTTKDRLFDLRADPDELKNLWNAPEHRERRRAMEQRLRAWMQSIGDPIAKKSGLLYQAAQ